MIVPIINDDLILFVNMLLVSKIMTLKQFPKGAIDAGETPLQ